MQCDATKRWLLKNNVEYAEVSLQEAPERLEEFKLMGYASAPIIKAGDSLWSGFRLDRLSELAA